jgi:copper chaperone CopZ
MKEITYHVHGMHCEACDTSIRQALGRLPGIQDIEIDHERGRVHVHYDDTQTDVLAIKAQIEQAGFEVG